MLLAGYDITPVNGMSASGGLHDVALKSKLLRSLLREYVPDEKHPFGNPSELSYVVSTIKTHKLLAESAPQPVDEDLIDAWKSAIDSWVHRLLTLASGNLPDKCWAGICLLGVTCQECSSERFLSSYVVWLTKLLSHIQGPAVSHFVKATSCASLSDMFTRLSGFSSAKKDATSHAARVILPALKLLNEESSAFVLEEVMCLMCTMINLFPLSVQRHYDNVEAAIVLKLLSGKCCASVLKKLSCGLSLLPKSRGDEDSWSLMMDKILLCLNSQLTDAFQGLEEEAKSTETMRALLPSGKESPAPLGGLAVSEQLSDLSTRRPERLLGSRISALMQCCCNMLSNSYPVMVPIPIRGLIALAERVLMVDCSFAQSTYAFMTTLKYEFMCSEIPFLQSRSLDFLTAVVKGLGSQILPHVAGIVQMLNQYMTRCKFPDLRKKVYSILKVLLISRGVGMAIHLSQDAVSNVFIDLDFFGDEKDDRSPGMLTKVHTDSLSKSRRKKRKHSNIARSFQEQPVIDRLEVEVPRNLIPISLRIAALEALEALLTVGGFMRSESWRANVDRLVVNVATNACRGGWSREEKGCFLSDDPMPTWADFQLAALRALLASLLSPGRLRPSHLALGLKLLQRGRQETGTKLAEYCGHALLTLEVLIHPRALPMLDLHSSPDQHKFLSHKLHDSQISAYQAGAPGKGCGEPESEDDDLYENWLGNDDELEIQDVERQPNVHFTEKPSASARDPSLDELPSVKVASISPPPKNNELTLSASVPSNERLGGSSDYMLESPRFRNTSEERADTKVSTDVDGHVGVQSGTGALENVESDPGGTRISDASAENDVVLKNDVISKGNEGTPSTSEHQVLETKDDRLTTIVERISATLPHGNRGVGSLFESDNESADLLPDIVDGDPDSD